MKTTDVTNAPVYGIQAGYAVKSEIAKNTADAKKTANPRDVKEAKDTKDTKDAADEPKKKVSSEEVDPSESKDSPINTKVQFSIERELNLIITRVMDASTNKVIHQIPAEETIKRLKLKYQQSLAQKGTSTNDVIV